MKFTRYEIQAFTQTGDLDAELEPVYGWIPIPELHPRSDGRWPSAREACRIGNRRDGLGRFQELTHAHEFYRKLQAERPGVIFRLRKIVVQEIYATLDGSDSDDEDRVRRESVVLEPASWSGVTTQTV